MPSYIPAPEAENEAAAHPHRRRRRLSPAQRFTRFLRRFLAVFLSTVLVLLVFLYAVCLVLTHGPSENARTLFVLSAKETSAMKFLPHWFLSDQTIDEILNPPRSSRGPDVYRELSFEPAEGAAPETPEPTPLVQTTNDAVTDEIEVIDIRKPTFKGKLMIVHDPSRVVVGTLDQYGGVGLQLMEFVEKYNAVGGTNAGAFEDTNGGGNGGTPDGLVIKDGYINYGRASHFYVDVIGFDQDHVLHVGDMTGQQALDLGIQTGVSFPWGPVLIKDGVKMENLGGGINPRTCIGQRADRAVLLLVVEGRHADSLGATYDDLADLMYEYGAVNAGNLDGGSSSIMIYEGEQITRNSNLVTGSRPMCTCILVLEKGAES